MNDVVPGVLGQLNDIFERRTKTKLVAATLGSLVVAVLDTAAIALVYPLVNLATGADTSSGALNVISDLLGDPEPRELTLILTGAVVTLFILKDLGSMAFGWWMSGLIFTERVRTSARILRHFLRSPYTQVSRRSSAELLRAMDYAVMQVFNYTVNGLMYLVSNALAVIAIVIALLVVSPLPTLGAVAYFGAAALVYLKVVKPRAGAAGVVMNDASLAGWRTAFAALGAIKELNLRGTQEHFVRHYQEAQLRGAHAGRLGAFLSGLPRYLLEILFIIAIGLILLIGVSTTSADSPGDLLGLLALFVAAGFRLLPSVTGLLSNSSNIKIGARSLDIVRTEVLAARSAERRFEEDDSRLPFRDLLHVEDVTFRYPGSAEPVLSAVSLEIPRGTSTALVGGSGAGKTTLVDVILGLHRPDSGRVTVDGVDVNDHARAWQRNIGYVAQDVFILDATLAENVAFDQEPEDIDRELLEHVLRQSQLEDLVAELAEGVDTPLGEKGTRLSGGQRQRVGIARALYRRPRLLVFDEATSALDNETEHRITETVRALRGDVTTIIVAHRLSTVRHCDQIAFLKNGRIQTAGSFAHVRASNADFRRLVELGSLETLVDREA